MEKRDGDNERNSRRARLHPDSREFREILESIMPPTFYHIRDPSLLQVAFTQSWTHGMGRTALPLLLA